MFSRTIAVLRWTARATIVFVALLSGWAVLAVRRRPYFDDIFVLILSSSRLKEATILVVVLAILTDSDKS
jgi:hypothetical protein